MSAPHYVGRAVPDPIFGDEPMTEAEFLGLDTVVNNSLVRLNAAETAADELVRLYYELRKWLPSTVSGSTARIATAWEEVRA